MHAPETAESDVQRYTSCRNRENCCWDAAGSNSPHRRLEVSTDSRLSCFKLIVLTVIIVIIVHIVSRDTPLPLIAQSLTYVADDASKLPSLLMYLAKPYNPPVLVFTSSQPRASSLAEELTLHGIRNVDCLHAGITKKEREDAISRMRKGETWILISTEVMARGMDFKGVREVINYDFPTSVQSYIHRVGACLLRHTVAQLLNHFRANGSRWARGKSRHILHGR